MANHPILALLAEIAQLTQSQRDLKALIEGLSTAIVSSSSRAAPTAVQLSNLRTFVTQISDEQVILSGQTDDRMERAECLHKDDLRWFGAQVGAAAELLWDTNLELEETVDGLDTLVTTLESLL
ncbi:hypothetical protein FN846DRAFT_912609 [Sphaerosporella brunnea]|uniref:Uncharacterized protein n=1 Tax=Sphaerosporella brunnea TaxID=1250544 RepID=A0A5J5EHJ5_9PEZI|nr:hypothetical protein FN846DRAFT_912609 [Sphaerosporella brunnea]